jgi:hypothetical protein
MLSVGDRPGGTVGCWHGLRETYHPLQIAVRFTHPIKKFTTFDLEEQENSSKRLSRTFICIPSCLYGNSSGGSYRRPRNINVFLRKIKLTNARSNQTTIP